MKNVKNLSDREKMAAILQYLRIKIAEFAAKTGASADHLYNLNSGKINEFSQEVRKKILSTYREINPQWLLTGEGEMLRQDSSSQSGSVGDNSGIIVQHGDNSTYHNHPDLSALIASQQETIAQQQATIAMQTEHIGRLIDMLSQK